MSPGLKPAPLDQSDPSPALAAPHHYARLLSLLIPVLALPAFLLAVIRFTIWTRTPHVPFFDEWK